MNILQITINNEQPTERIHVLNMINHIRGFALERVKFLKILAKNLKFILRVKNNWRFSKVNILLSQKSYTFFNKYISIIFYTK